MGTHPIDNNFYLSVEEGACGEVYISPSGARWFCIRKHHGGDHPYVDQHRRNAGKIPSADRHVFVREKDRRAYLREA